MGDCDSGWWTRGNFKGTQDSGRVMGMVGEFLTIIM